MFNKVFIPFLAIAGIAITVYTVRSHAKPSVETTNQPLVQPVLSPYEETISGSGLVEASSENIAIATQIAGVVTEVPVKPGDRVAKGDVLFRIDDRELKAERATRNAQLLAAEQELARLKSLPRPEDVPIAEAELREAEAEAKDRLADASRATKLLPSGAIEAQAEENARHEADSAVARAEFKRAQLEKLLAGSWEPELEIARAEVASAKAQLDAINVELERLIVRAPIDGEILSTSVRAGQYAPTGILEEPLVMMGETTTLRLRVDVDENDAWRVKPGTPSKAFLRGNPKISADVSFLRIEPAVVPKKSLTGFNNERTDTRVLQIIFTVPRSEFPAYVGQLVDVRIAEQEG